MLASEKSGDNAQCLSLANALGWQTEIKHLRFHELGRGWVRPFGDDRFELDRVRSSSIEPPWPDLVIGCGRRSVPTAFEIRQRAGVGTRLVQLGRPRAHLDRFDLVVTTPQYRLPERGNVLHLMLPMHQVDHAERALAGEEWAPQFSNLPRPHIAVLIGGDAQPFVFDSHAARCLAWQLNELVRAEGGSLLVSTSRRTSEAAAKTLCDLLEVPSYIHRWTPGGGPNPYSAYLALAEAFVVTGDSVSMLAEACGTGRRVWFAELPKRRSPRSRIKNVVRRLFVDVSDRANNHEGSLARWVSAAPERGWVRYPRDLEQLHARLVASGRALPLGQPFEAPTSVPPDESACVAERILELF